MSDPSGRTPIDVNGAPSEPKQAVVKVKACLGCGKLPHGSSTETLKCVTAALVRSRAETAEAQGAIADVRAAAQKDIEAARAHARELQWELDQRRAKT